MEEVQTYQNGHSKVYTEVSEDGTVTEYEERYVIDDDSESATAYRAGEGLVFLQDEDDVKVYQRQEVLPDGREMITTTTITVNEKGEAVEETVTEIVESKEVELDEEEEEEEADDDLVYEIPAPAHNLPSRMEDSTHSTDVTDALVKDRKDDLDSNAAVEPVKTISRRISYEEFAEQYTEYKPPKRYEKKQTVTTADKAAPKIRIMTSETSEEEGNTGEKGLPNSDSMPTTHVTGSASDTLTSPGSKHSSHGEDMAEEASFSQPTRTQGSVMRRMDQNSVVDPANVVRADEKPDLEAELPSRGTSQSLKSKFQAMGGVDTRQIDFSQPVRREKPKVNQERSSVGAVLTDDAASSHRVPEFEGGEIENTPEVRLDVVREADKNDQEELPEMGQARNLLSKWSQIESELSTRKEYTPSGVGSKPTVTPMRPSSRVVTEEEELAEPEGGEYENTPVERTDVIKETDPLDLELELPSVGLAKSIMHQFKQKEAEAKKTPAYQPSGAGNRAPKVNTRASSVSSADSHPEPQFEGGAVENVPILRDDVVRETDVTVNHELPEPGYAKNLKARLRELQEQQTPSDYVEHRPSGVANKMTPTPHRLSSGVIPSTSVSSISSGDEVDNRIEPQLEAGEYESQPMKRTDVIREEDRHDEQELPEAGLARNLMNRFKTLESDKPQTYKPSGVGAKPTPTPLRPQHLLDREEIVTSETVVAAPEMGAWESTPVTRTDVVRETDALPGDDLPSQGVTRSLQSQYSALTSQQIPTYTPSGVSRKPTPTPLRPQPSVDIDEIITQESVMPAPEMGAWESTPVVRMDVVRETDSLLEDDLPSQGVTRSLQSQYTQLANQQVADYTPSGVSQKPTPTPLRPQPSVDVEEIITQETVMPAPEMGTWESSPLVRTDVVRETDALPEDDLPSEGVTLSLQSQYSNLANQQTPDYTPSGVSQKPTPTPLWPRPSVDPEEIINQETVMPAPEMGVWESAPAVRTDLVKETDALPKIYLPTEGLTRSRQLKFSDLNKKQTPSYRASAAASKATPSKLHIMAGKSSYSAKGIIPEPVVNSVVEEVPQVEAGEYENTPMVRDDVVRADTRIEHNDLPEQGVTKNIRSRFKSLEQENQASIQHRPSKTASKPTPTPLRPTSASTQLNDTASTPPVAVEPELSAAEVGQVNGSASNSADQDQNDYVPTAGVAKSLTDKFRQMELRKSEQVEHRPSKVASSLTPTPLQLKR